MGGQLPVAPTGRRHDKQTTDGMVDQEITAMVHDLPVGHPERVLTPDLGGSDVDPVLHLAIDVTDDTEATLAVSICRGGKGYNVSVR